MSIPLDSPAPRTLDQARELEPRVSELDRALAANLRQASANGKAHIGRLLTAPDAGEELAGFLAAVTYGLRADAAGMRHQLVEQGDENNALRRALEFVVCNRRLPPESYPDEYRALLERLLGRSLPPSA